VSNTEKMRNQEIVEEIDKKDDIETLQEEMRIRRIGLLGELKN